MKHTPLIPRFREGRNANRRGMSYTILTPSQKRKAIVARKRQGDFTEVAQDLGYTPAYVSSVIAGRFDNKTILNRVYDKVRGRLPKNVTA